MSISNPESKIDLTAPGSGQPRTLFVVSGAFGDLTLALSFIHGQQFAARAAVMLPPHLHEANRDGLPVRTYPYRSAEGIVRTAVEWDANIVFLLSAYGFPIEGLCAPVAVGYFVDFLQQQDRRVVTSDPFLGSAATVTKAAVHQMLPAPRDWLQDTFVTQPSARRIARDLNRISTVLRGVVHLYPGSVDFAHPDDGVRRLAFFNQELTRPDIDREDSGSGDPDSGDTTSSRRTWLFVLAPNDVALQQKKTGVAAFESSLRHLFEQAAAAGRRAVLIGPSALIEPLKGRLPSSLGAVLLGFCSYREFSARLRNAEYAFFWNVFSCSAVLGRLVRKLPVFFLDRGHVAHFSGKIYEDGLRCYFGGWEPSQVSPGALDPQGLADLAANQARRVEGLLVSWRQASTPEQVIERILRGAGS